MLLPNSSLVNEEKADNVSIETFLKPSGAVSLFSVEFSKFMDTKDPLRQLRNEFIFPKVKNVITKFSEYVDEEADCIYLCGNSLGLQSKKSREMIERELTTWADIAVEGWFKSYTGKLPWTKIEDLEQPETNMENTMAKLVGAKPIEVSATTSLTQNLNSLLLTFYKPTPVRHKILIETKAFPSDRYAVEAQIQYHDYDPETSLIALSPRVGEHCLRTEDILEVIENQGHEIAVVMLPGIQYYTGQFFQMEEITVAGHAKGCIVGWDLAHAAGNVPLKLHDWNVDFAVWCTYKYLNSGPGGIGGLFLHERHAYKRFEGSRLAGWWAVAKEQRFKMEDVYIPRPGAAGYSQSTVNVLSLSSLMGSLQVFAQTDIDSLRKKSLLLTGYLEILLKSEIPVGHLKIITPMESEHRGCQLSVIFQEDKFESIHSALRNHGVVCDKRHPDCIRIAPVPLYSTFEDIRGFVAILKKVLQKIDC